MNVLKMLVSPRGAVFLLLVGLLIAMISLNPRYGEPDQFLRFVQRVAPVALVALGQYFVIVAGEFDLSQGSLITAQVIIAGNLVGQDDTKTIPVLIGMLIFGAFVGFVNGVLTTALRIPSFIVTLGMMLALRGGVMWWTGGAATGNPADSFRAIGRSGITDVPLLKFVPYSVLVLIGCVVVAIWLTKRPYGKTLMALGNNPRAAQYAGARNWWVTTRAFIISSVAATISGVLLVGFAGVHPSVGVGYEFTAITAVVLGGVVLGGGRGWIVAALAGAFVLETLFVVLNFANVPSTMRDTVQGVIIIAAVAYAGVAFRSRRKRGGSTSSPESGEGPETPVASSEAPALVSEGPSHTGGQ